MGYGVLTVASVPFPAAIILTKFGFYVTAGILMPIPLKGESRLAEWTHVLGPVARLMGAQVAFIPRSTPDFSSAALYT